MRKNSNTNKINGKKNRKKIFIDRKINKIVKSEKNVINKQRNVHCRVETIEQVDRATYENCENKQSQLKAEQK